MRKRIHNALLSILLLLYLPSISFAEPVIHFEETSYDFGTVAQEDDVRHFFELTNDGDQELVIEKVSAS